MVLGINCLSCQSGRFSDGTANEACSECPAGTSSDGGASECTACKASSCDHDDVCDLGTYSYGEASAACLACPYPLATTTRTCLAPGVGGAAP